MASTFAGRSHAFPKAQEQAYRNLAVLSWMLGMLLLGNDVQTSITAIRVLPTASPPIQTLEELQPHLDTFAMAPCVTKAWTDVIAHMIMPGHAPLIRMILKSFYMCQNTYITYGDIFRCYEKTLAGTHVALSTCGDEDISSASQLSLNPSSSLCSFTQLAAMQALHPARYQHRRILLAIAEHGLAVPHWRRAIPRMKDEDPGALPFFLYFGVYLVGCAMSCAALAAELLCRLKQRPKLGDISRHSES
ncbi:hypothetical protein HPB49_011519 [Dermacentor silvarum]|uniref:Uncharacterized protein n=1 Tax=Dermacentor silvarum TaxID=543639 RepID=A0ACB8C952_DERSI|nr:hypothetical protein HPB49_011519 [Dermacentor silvarum]